MSLHRSSRVICLTLLCVFVFCGCALAGPPSLSKVEAFNGFDVYYAGQEVAGLQFEDFWGVEPKGDPQSAGWTFVYGDCEQPQGEGGCSPPLEIQVGSTCHRWFSGLGPRKRTKRNLYDFRGAKATGGGGPYELSPMEIFTGRTTVVIWGNEKNVIKSAARQLREVGQKQPSLHLPPPVPGSLWGKLPCQRKPG